MLLRTMSEGDRLVRFRSVECQLWAAEQGVTVQLAGEIDISVAEELGTWLLSASNGQEDLTLDLSKIRFMDSTGLHMLIRLKRALGAAMHLGPLSDPVRGLLKVTGMTKFFD